MRRAEADKPVEPDGLDGPDELGQERRPYEDKKVETVDLPGIGVIAQENEGPATEGGGEWPDPHTPPRGPSPGRGD